MQASMCLRKSFNVNLRVKPMLIMELKRLGKEKVQKEKGKKKYTAIIFEGNCRSEERVICNVPKQ